MSFYAMRLQFATSDGPEDLSHEQYRGGATRFTFREWGGRVVRWCWVNFQCRGRPANLDYSRARAYCAYSRCGWGLFGRFFSRLSFLLSFSLSLGDGPI